MYMERQKSLLSLPKPSLSVRGCVVLAEHTAVTNFVLQNPYLTTSASVEEKIGMVRILANSIEPREECRRVQRAVLLLFQNMTRDEAEGRQIIDGLGGRKWLQANLSRITNHELRLFAECLLSK